MSVKYGILAALNRRSMHGYELRRELVDELGTGWSVNFGQIYTTLERLSRAGFVVQSEKISSADAPDRKLYTVTPAGRAELQSWFLTPAEGSETGRDELYAKVMLGLRGDVGIERVIQAQRKGQLRRIGLLTELKDRLDPDLELAEMLQVDLAIAKTDAVLRWLDAAEARIRKAQASEPSGIAGGGRRSPTNAGESERKPERARETEGR
jgi:DNA-binding PadR family transcriptional regulator